MRIGLIIYGSLDTLVAGGYLYDRKLGGVAWRRQRCCRNRLPALAELRRTFAGYGLTFRPPAGAGCY